MREALAQAADALRRAQVPVGCVIVQDGAVVARAANDTSNSPIDHAEIRALAQIDAAQPFDLYVTVEPCIMCAAALAQTNVQNVYYGAQNTKFGGCGGVMKLQFEPPWRNYNVHAGILADEAVDLLKQFFDRPNEKFN